MASVVRRLQLTLALIKPDVTVNPTIEEASCTIWFDDFELHKHLKLNPPLCQ